MYQILSMNRAPKSLYREYSFKSRETQWLLHEAFFFSARGKKPLPLKHRNIFPKEIN